ncbi:MAG: antibiotic biosynthesis monooxygenase [Thermodesulfobacteriota bacterium]
MAVKIIIRRKVPRGREAELLPLLLELRTRATTRPGYVSGETLRNVNDPEDYLVISTWQSTDVWRAWEQSRARKEIQEKIDALLGEKTVYDVYFYG